MSEENQQVDWSQFHVNIAMPCYGGMVSEATMASIMQFILYAQQTGLNWSYDSVSNESLVTRARNNLCAKMMSNEQATHFMFIDSDIRFDPLAVFAMLAADKDVIGGIYPKKGIPIDYNVNLNEHTDIQGDLFTVKSLGNGFLLFKREVYEKLIEAHPETKYIDDVNFGKEYEQYMYAIFDTVIDETGRYNSEDWTFCQRWQALGGSVWCHGKVLLNHIGNYEFQGDLSKVPAFARVENDVAKYESEGNVPPALLDILKMRTPKKETK